MNRYISKAKTLDGEWVQGYYVKEFKKYMIVNYEKIMTPFGEERSMTYKQIDSNTLCMCTGKEGANKDLIFEGDYFWLEDAEGEIGVIYWDNDRCAWWVRSVPNTVENECVPDFSTTIENYELGEFLDSEIHIIGNVHDRKVVRYE